MPIDPISLAIQGGGMLLDLFKGAGQAENARRNQAYQREAVARAAAGAQEGRAGAMRLAGSLRQDQFGNATYYDPTQGRWVTYYTPTQRRLIQGGEERQGRAQARGAQASQDYDRLRGEYLYRRPKSEAESYAEIIRLISQAMGTGERALNTLTNRWGVRTAGNLPQLMQLDRGPTPGQQLAETMLKGRQSALDESLRREAGHTSRYLPALKQFEETANYVAPVDPTGSGIVSMTQQGLSDMLKYGSEYDKLIGQIEASGSRVGGGGDGGGGGPSFSNMAGQLAKLLNPGQEKGEGTLGRTRGARASTSGGGSGGYRGTDYGGTPGGADVYGVTRGYAGDRPYTTSRTGERSTTGAAGQSFSGTFGQGGYDPNQITSFDPRFGDTFTGLQLENNLPYRNNYAFTDVYSYEPEGTYADNPFGKLWQF